jgi:hypothetical protein
MKLTEIFAQDITRPIDGVIKADDREKIAEEVREYVITQEVDRKLSRNFFDTYNEEEANTNGVWISGFFGSGKSHLLKMLSLLLEDRELEGRTVSEHFVDKVEGNDFLRGEIARAARIPTKSILFNIDSKANTLDETGTDSVLAVFNNVFNEMQGYYPKFGYLAELERDMDRRGVYQAFKEEYAKLEGEPWEEGRDQLHLIEESIGEAYAKVSNMSQERAEKLLDRYREDYTLSIDTFTQRVADYLDEQAPGYRLNFFVDEVGQFISDNTKLMTNLQTIAENLYTKCKGRSWVFVTSQEDMDAVLGGLKDRQSQDFSKIQGRFGCKLNLSSQNVDEVIRRRLLEKNGAGTQVLSELYHQEQHKLATLFGFREGGTDYRTADSEEEFVSMYPFQPFHFDLLQECIRQLSAKNAFMGKHASVGERSMLSVFQEVAKSMIHDDMEVGRLPAFDRLFDGLQPILRGEVQSSINTARKNLSREDPYALRVLKTLFLVKYVETFVPTAGHIAILMRERFDGDPKAHENRVKSALNLLERQSYIQRVGQRYEFLTSEEKEIESDIKNTAVDPGQEGNLMAKFLFDDVIGLDRVVHERNKQVFRFNKQLDGNAFGQSRYELVLNVITPRNENYGSLDNLKGQIMGLDETRFVLPADDELLTDIGLYLKTKTFADRHLNTKGQKGLIIQQRALENNQRRDGILARLREAMSRATIIIGGEEIKSIGGSEPRNRVAAALQLLVRRTYHNLDLLPTGLDERQLRDTLDRPTAELLGEAANSLGPAEEEVMNYVQRQSNRHERVTARRLIQHFGAKPYGWSEMGTLNIVARLLATNRLDARAEGHALPLTQTRDYLLNRDKLDVTQILPLARIGAGKLRALRQLQEEVFGKVNTGKEAKDTAAQFDEVLQSELARVNALRRRRRDYPFVEQLDDYAAALKRYIGRNYTDYFDRTEEMDEALADLREEVYLPIREFIGSEEQPGEQARIYDDIRQFLDRGEDNHRHLDGDLTQPLYAVVRSEAPYRAGTMRAAAQQLETAKEAVRELLDRERQQANAKVDFKESAFTAAEEYTHLTDTDRRNYADRFDQVRRQLDNQVKVDYLRDRLRRFEQTEFVELMSDMARTGFARAHPETKVTAVPATTDRPPTDKPPTLREPKTSYQRLPLEVAKQQAGLHYIKSEKDLARYTEGLRTEILRLLDEGNGILL